MTVFDTCFHDTPPKPTREKILEVALKEIQEIADYRTPDKWDWWQALEQIKDKCEEALRVQK